MCRVAEASIWQQRGQIVDRCMITRSKIGHISHIFLFIDSGTQPARQWHVNNDDWYISRAGTTGHVFQWNGCLVWQHIRIATMIVAPEIDAFELSRRGIKRTTLPRL